MLKRFANINNHKAIFHLAIPNILSHITVPLLSSVDTALVGHLENVSYLAAVALGSLFFNSIYWMFYFLRMTTTGMSAQAYGQNDPAKLIAVFIKAIIIALATGVIFIILQKPFAFLFFYVVESSQEVKDLALSYFLIRIWAAPATLALTVIQGWFLGMQNARYPLVLAVATNIVNILLNILFVYGFHLNSDGVAYGTLITQYLGLILAFGLFWRRYKSYWHNRDWELVKNLENIKRFFTISLDLFIRTACLVFVFIFFNFKAAAIGDVVLAANNVLFQLWIIHAYSVDGVALAAESLVGKYTGSGDKSELKTTVINIFFWALSLGALYALVYQLFGPAIIRIFTNQLPVIALCEAYLFWIVIASVVNSVSFTWDGIFMGSTASKSMRDSLLLSAFLIYFPCYWLTNEWLDLANHGLWLSFTLFFVARGLTLCFAAPRDVWG